MGIRFSQTLSGWTACAVLAGLTSGCLQVTQDIHRLRRGKYAMWRESAARDLGESGSRRAVPHLIRALDDEHSGVVCEVAEALAKIGDRSAVEPLAARLARGPTGANSEQVRKAVAEALGTLGDARASSTLTSALRDDPSGSVKLRCATALGKIADPRSAGRLTALLMHQEAHVRRYAALALDRAGLAPTDEEYRAWFLCGRRTPEGASVAGVIAVKPLLLALIGDSADWSWLVAIEDYGADLHERSRSEAASLKDSVLRELDAVGAPAVDPLIRFLGHRDARLRAIAAWALGEMTVQAPRSADLASCMSRDDEARVRSAAARALGRLKAADAIDSLTAALSDRSARVSAYAAWALGEMGERARRAIPMLIERFPKLDGRVTFRIRAKDYRRDDPLEAIAKEMATDLRIPNAFFAEIECLSAKPVRKLFSVGFVDAAGHAEPVNRGPPEWYVLTYSYTWFAASDALMRITGRRISTDQRGQDEWRRWWKAQRR